MKKKQIDTRTSVRVDKELVRQADIVIKRCGLSTNQVVNMLLNQIILRKEIPFKIKLEAVETKSEED